MMSPGLSGILPAADHQHAGPKLTTYSTGAATIATVAQKIHPGRFRLSSMPGVYRCEAGAGRRMRSGLPDGMSGFGDGSRGALPRLTTRKPSACNLSLLAPPEAAALPVKLPAP